MGFIDWLRRLFRPAPLTRDVSRLGGEGQDVDLVEETVDVSGGPLKEHHRRRAIRDPRLLPKPKPKTPFWPRKRKRVMTAGEAGRLFSATMRTRNRQVRDLVSDPEQLARYGLPTWNTEADLANALGVSVKLLRHFSIHRPADRVCHYVTFSIPKRSGGSRLILAPKQRLKGLQRQLLRLLVEKLPVNPHAHGFRAGRSIRTAAEPHVGRAVVVSMDLKDFFPTVTFARVRGLLIALGYGYQVATALACLMTECQRQPVEIGDEVRYVPVGPRHCVQGAPTSPAMCNAIVLRLDRRLAGLARKLGFAYTRYADDLVFSGDDPGAVQGLVSLTSRICRDEGFEVNGSKTRITRKGRRQTVTGVVVNKTLGLSRKERRRLRAAAHRLQKDRAAGVAIDPRRMSHLRGKLAYVAMLNPDQAESLRRQLS